MSGMIGVSERDIDIKAYGRTVIVGSTNFHKLLYFVNVSSSLIAKEGISISDEYRHYLNTDRLYLTDEKNKQLFY